MIEANGAASLQGKYLNWAKYRLIHPGLILAKARESVIAALQT
jgi:hypothetical protein